MGTVHRLAASHETTLGDAVAAFLATKNFPDKQATYRAYSAVLARLTAELGDSTPLSHIEPEAVAGWFTAAWAGSAPATWNAKLAVLKSAGSYWERQGWITAQPARMIESRKIPRPPDRAMSREQAEALLSRRDIALREKLLWTMAFESAARIGELLSLDVEDLDLPNRCAVTRRKGGRMDTIAWQSRTARLIPRYLKGRTRGPLFLTERRARVALAPADLDPDSGRARLGYRQAEDQFKAASGQTLHVWRHTALTLEAESGTSLLMLKAISGHTSLRSLERYARVSREAMLRHRAETDPSRRKR